ncbi:hypothetical protein FD951_16775 [Pseudomonas chlororaphis subsp. aurantiaca]|nr:hypothetical protein FD951_16775 [Pseudomonas chlororaphis subsp. aurantiaca]
MLAMVVNDDAYRPGRRAVLQFIASKLRSYRSVAASRLICRPGGTSSLYHHFFQGEHRDPVDAAVPAVFRRQRHGL